MWLLAMFAVVGIIGAIYFAFESAQNRQALEKLEGENIDLLARLSSSRAEIRRLRELSGISTEANDPLLQAPDDELMPLRKTNRGLRATRSTTKAASDTWNTVVFIGKDPAEKTRLIAALTPGGYRLQEATTASEAQRLAHELSTAALIFDLRDATLTSITQAVADALVADPLAREVPLFAIVPTAKERERLQEEGTYAAAFTAPVDVSLITSTLGAAMIRRKTRVRRAEAARSISASVAQS